MKDNSTRVVIANGEIEAQQIKAFLESNDIPCTFFGESLRKTHGLTLSDLGRVEIHAAEKDVPRAKKLLLAADAGELTLAEDEDPEPGVSL